MFDTALAKLDAQQKRDRLMFFPEHCPEALRPFHEYQRVGDITRALLVGPNRGAKTTRGAIDVLLLLHGKHPWKKPTHNRPIRGWAVGYSAKQMLAVMRVVRQWAPADWVIGEDWNEDRGYLNAKLKIRHAPSNGVSWLEFRTAGENQLGLASADLDIVWPDEPMREEHVNELSARVMLSKGFFISTLTAVGAPVEYLRRDVEKDAQTVSMGPAFDGYPLWETTRNERWQYTRFSFDPRNCPHITREDVDVAKRVYSRAEWPQRIYGQWEGVDVDRWFSSFDPKENVSEFTPGPQWRFGVSIDHGERPGTQVFVLLAYTEDNVRPQVHVLGEATNRERTDYKKDAKALLDLLARNDLTINDLDWIVGDINSGGKSMAGLSANAALAYYVAEEVAERLGIKDPKYYPTVSIEPARKGSGSVDWGWRVLSYGFGTGDFAIVPGLEKVRNFLLYWKNSATATDAGYLHAGDALRYGVCKAVGLAGVYPGL